MTRSKLPPLWARNQRFLLALLGVLVAVGLVVAYAVLGLNRQDQIWSNLIAELVVLILVPIGWYYVFARRGISFSSMQSEHETGAIVSFYPHHDEVDWPAIIAAAKRLDIVVHYYGRWVRRHDAAFKAFFERGGAVNLVVADPTNAPLMETVRGHFFPALSAEELVKKVEATEEKLHELFDVAGSKRAALATYHFPNVLHYAFVLADSRYLYLSVYEQFRGNNVRSSVFGIDLTKNADLETYWLETRDHFLKSSRKHIHA